MAFNQNKYPRVKLDKQFSIMAFESMILNLIDYTCSIYKSENLETQTAYKEAQKLIFSKPQSHLHSLTVAQWIAQDGDEYKAREVIRDFIAESKAKSKKSQEKNKIKKLSKTMFKI